MAFSADELRVLRRALAEAMHPSRGGLASRGGFVPRPAEHVQECLRLAQAVDDAMEEGGRLRAFLLAELHRYRQALPGGAAGYLERLAAALDGGYVPGADDLAALRRLRALPCGTPEHLRRVALLRHCETLAENDVRLRLEAHMPAPRRLLTLHRLADEPEPAPAAPPRPAAPGGKPNPDTDPAKPQDPNRRTPTPAEIWPPNRRTPKPDQQAARSA